MAETEEEIAAADGEEQISVEDLSAEDVGQEAADEDEAADGGEAGTEAEEKAPAVKVPYHTNMSRKDRRKLKRMKKFRR